jgi:hypothetical protein
MEASAAGLAASDAGGGGEQQQQGEQADGQQTQQPDLSALATQLQDVPAQLEQMRSFMEQSQLAQAPQDAAEEEPAAPDLSFVDPESPTYDPQRAAEQLLEVLGQQQQQAVTQAVEPLQNALSEMQAARDADYLAQEFPELQNPETADAVLKATQEWVNAAGLPPEAASNMQVVRAVFMMGRAAELHNAETATDGQQQQAATLEGAGGASPAGSTPGGLTAESIVNGPGGRSPLPF